MTTITKNLFQGTILAIRSGPYLHLSTRCEKMRNVADASCTQYRKARESFLIKPSRTAFPSGLKLNFRKNMKKKKKNVMAGRPSPFHNRTKFAQSKKLKHRTPIDIRGKTIKHQLSRMCFYDFFFSTTMIFLKELLQHWINKIFLIEIFARLMNNFIFLGKTCRCMQ